MSCLQIVGHSSDAVKRHCALYRRVDGAGDVAQRVASAAEAEQDIVFLLLLTVRMVSAACLASSTPSISRLSGRKCIE